MLESYVSQFYYAAQVNSLENKLQNVMNQTVNQEFESCGKLINVTEVLIRKF